MDRIFCSSPAEAEAIRQERAQAGAIEISQSGLTTALGHILEEKRRALDMFDWEAAKAWRVNERSVADALAGFGLLRPIVEKPGTL